MLYSFYSKTTDLTIISSPLFLEKKIFNEIAIGFYVASISNQALKTVC